LKKKDDSVIILLNRLWLRTLSAIHRQRVLPAAKLNGCWALRTVIDINY
jgi:hypothetical protein